MITLWQISLRYLLAHMRQTLICVLGVAISVTMFLAMFGMMLGFREKFIIDTVESSGHIIVNDEPRVTATPILERAYATGGVFVVDRVKPRDNVKKIKNPTGLASKLRRLPGVTAVAPMVYGDCIATYGTKTMTIEVQGIDPEEQQRVTTIGEKLVEGNFQSLYGAADGVVIGRGVATTLGAKNGDSIMLSSSTGGRTYARIVGIFETGVVPIDFSRSYMLTSNAQTLLDKKNVINQLMLRTDDYLRAPEYAAQIEAISGYKTESWQESNSNFLTIFKVQDVITYIITGALLVVAAFGVLNILIMAVLERVNDIAILKSIGFTRRDITLVFMNQGLLIGLIGGVAGVACGKVFIELLRMVPIQMEGLVKVERMLIAESSYAYILALVASNIAVLLAAVYPARRAASADPVDVIRGAH